MIKAGVIDPTKVVRAALQGAVSVASCSSRRGGHGGREAEAPRNPQRAGGQHAPATWEHV